MENCQKVRIVLISISTFFATDVLSTILRTQKNIRQQLSNIIFTQWSNEYDTYAEEIVFDVCLALRFRYVSLKTALKSVCILFANALQNLNINFIFRETLLISNTWEAFTYVTAEAKKTKTIIFFDSICSANIWTWFTVSRSSQSLILLRTDTLLRARALINVIRSSRRIYVKIRLVSVASYKLHIYPII